MAKFQETFSGNNNGAFPGGWTARNNVGGALSDWAVRDDGSALDGKILKYNDAALGSSGIRHITWDAPGSVADCNILMKIKGLSTSIPVWLVARAADGDNLYGGLRSSASGSPLVLKRLAGSQSTVASGTQPDTYASGIYYKYRLDISGSDVKFKLWRATDPEPAAYQAANPDTDITAANPLGLWAFNTQQADIDWISAGTSGDVADDLEPVVTGPDYTSRKGSTLDSVTHGLGTLTTATLNAVNVFDHVSSQAAGTVDFAGAITDEITTSGEYDLVLGDGVGTETYTVQVNVIGLPVYTLSKDGSQLGNLTGIDVAVTATDQLVSTILYNETNLTATAGVMDSALFLDTGDVGDVVTLTLHTDDNDGVSVDTTLELL